MHLPPHAVTWDRRYSTIKKIQYYKEEAPLPLLRLFNSWSNCISYAEGRMALYPLPILVIYLTAKMMANKPEHTDQLAVCLQLLYAHIKL